jgi:hypothetical protein
MDPQYHVVSPIGDARDASGRQKLAAGASPLDTLRGKKLGLIWAVFANGDIVLRAFREHLATRYPDLQFVEMPPGRGLNWGDHPEASVAELARENGLHAAVVAAGC